MTVLSWDAPKRLANLDKHGFDFEDVFAFDWSTAVISAGRPDRLGRPRRKAVGYFRGEVVVIIYAPLGSEAISIISFRHAKLKERLLVDGKR